MVRHYGCPTLGALVVAILLVEGPSAEALSDQTLRCTLDGGDGIVVTMRVAVQGTVQPSAPPGAFFSLTGAWDDASLAPFLPIYGGIVDDPAFGLTGGFTRVGFSGFPLPDAPFATWPLAIHVQFRLAEPDTRSAALTGRWADNFGRSGSMSCLPQP